MSRFNRRMSAPLIQLQEKTQRELLKYTHNLFNKIDDALFEMAEKALSNSEQNIFFESMREIRLKRMDIEKQFGEAYCHGYVEMFRAQSEALDEPAEPEADDDGLSLMADDTVEEMVAVEAMVGKAERQFASQLDALEARISHAAEVAINRENNPLGPKKLCDIFCDACLLLSIDIKARLVVFKLFDKLVIDQLDRLYGLANEQLIAHKILPDYERKQRRNRTPAQQPAAAAAAATPGMPAQQGEGSSLGEEIYRLLNRLSATELAASLPAMQPLAGAIQRLPVSTSPAIGQDVLLQLLTSFQQDPHRLPGYNPFMVDNSGLEQPTILMPGQFTLSLQQSLSNLAEGHDHSIGQGDRDVINFVTMLFQFVLDDRSLAEPMKAVISRLQIPVIKVAICDASFFGQDSHPARRLLNEMTAAALGWTAEGDYESDPLYQSVCEAVDRINDEYVDDTAVFNEVLADFISFVENERKRVSLREKRIVDAEAGKDQSESARTYIGELVAERNIDARYPDFVRQMIEDAWQNVLFLTLVKEGEESNNWQQSLQAFDDLLWTVSAERCAEDRASIMQRIPGMLKVLREGLGLINYDAYAAGDFFARLEHLHIDVMQRGAPQTVDIPTLADVEEAAPEPAEAAPVVAEDSPYLARAKMLPVGQWVELIEGDRKTRCRLVAILRNSGKRIFASRTGAKAGEYSVEEIALRIEDESLLLLEDAQLFDKALSSIIDNLRQNREAAQA